MIGASVTAQSYTYNGLGDRVRVDKPTGTRHFVYDAWGRVIAEYGASVADVKAEFIWALPPAANDPGSGSGAGNSPFGGGDHIAGYAPLALVAENGASQLELYWAHGNHPGVPVVTTNVSGQVVTPANDFLRPGFPGQSQVLSDLYYNRAPSLLRQDLSVTPLPYSLNPSRSRADRTEASSIVSQPRPDITPFRKLRRATPA